MSQIADTVVIGGGVVGICSAYYLAEKGRNVTVVDLGDIGLGCSYGNAGLITPSFSVPLPRPGLISKGIKWMLDDESPFYIKPRIDLSMLSWLLRFGMACRTGPMQKGVPILRELNRASLALHTQLASVEGMDHSYKQDGLINLYRSHEGMQEGRREARLLDEYGILSNILDHRAVREIEPCISPAIVGGIYYKEDAHLDPAMFVRQLASLVKKRGVSLRTGVEVQDFVVSAQKIRAIRTTRGEILTDTVVLATGAWSPKVANMLRLKLPVQGAKGYSVTVKRPPSCPSHPLMLSEAKVAVTPMGSLLRFAGTLELAGFDFSINQRRVNAILRAVREYLFDTEGLESVETWCGLRPCTPDGLPIIGRSRLLKNLVIATGHGMLGVSMGPITGKLVSQLLSDEAPAISLMLLSPDRFQ